MPGLVDRGILQAVRHPFWCRRNRRVTDLNGRLIPALRRFSPSDRPDHAGWRQIMLSTGGFDAYFQADN
jgi:hypothetical protein